MSDNKGDINTSVWDEEWPRITWHYMPTSPRPLVLLHFCHSTDNITSEAVASKRPSVITVHSPSSRTATQQRIKTSAWCSIGWHQVEHRPSGFSMETIFSTERFHANEQILSLTEFKPELYRDGAKIDHSTTNWLFWPVCILCRVAKKMRDNYACYM